MLKRYLIKTTQQKLLAYFIEHPSQKIHERELVRITKFGAGAVNKTLNELHRANIIDREVRGKTFLYSLGYYDTAELRLLRTLLVVWRLEPLINALREISRRAILYGSASRGSHDDLSDIDLLIVAPEKSTIGAIVERFRRRLQRDGLRIQPVIKTTVEWARIERDDPVYFQEVMMGLTLWEKPHAV